MASARRVRHREDWCSTPVLRLRSHAVARSARWRVPLATPTAGRDPRVRGGCCQAAARTSAAGPQTNLAVGGGARVAAGSGARLGAGGVTGSGADGAARWLGGVGGVRLVLEELAVPFLPV